MQSVDNSRSSGEHLLSSSLGACAYIIRCYLRTGRKYALIKKHALNKHVRLLTRPRPDFTVYVYWLNLVYIQTQKMVSYIVALCIVVVL